MTAQATATASEFPFVEGLPQVVVKEAKRGAAAFRQVVEEYQAAQAKHGLLVPVSTVAEAVGISPQRVTQLLDEGRLQAVTVTGRRWVVAASVTAFLAQGPRPAGRPKKLSKLANSVRLGVELAAAAESLVDAGDA